MIRGYGTSPRGSRKAADAPMIRCRSARNAPRIGNVFALVGDDAVDEFKAVCAAYGLTPKELVHKLVTGNIAVLREDPFRGSLVERGIAYLREARRGGELASIHRSSHPRSSRASATTRALPAPQVDAVLLQRSAIGTLDVRGNPLRASIRVVGARTPADASARQPISGGDGTGAQSRNCRPPAAGSSAGATR